MNLHVLIFRSIIYYDTSIPFRTKFAMFCLVSLLLKNTVVGFVFIFYGLQLRGYGLM